MLALRARLPNWEHSVRVAATRQVGCSPYEAYEPYALCRGSRRNWKVQSSRGLANTAYSFFAVL